MNRHRDWLVSFCLLLAACSPASTRNETDAKTPDRMVSVRAAATVPAAPRGCSDRIHVALDEKSLIDAGDKPFPAARLNAFSGKVAAAFHGAADDTCRKTPAVRKALGAIRLLTIQSGSGATEATFYRTAEEKPGELVFQWVFNEEGLDVPKRADIQSGLRCWADPDRPECADMGD